MKIAVRAGHNYGVKGAVGILDEVDVTRAYYPYVIKFLRESGHEVLDVTPHSTDTKGEDLSFGVNKANNFGAEIFISCHVNSSNGEGHGCEAIYFPGSKEGEKYASDISKNISTLGFKNRGAKKDIRGLYELANTKMTAVIVEPFFLDNKIDVSIYKSTGNEKLGYMIAKAIPSKETASVDECFIPDTVKVFASTKNEPMENNIKLLQKIVGLSQNGVATEGLVRRLPRLVGGEQRGSVTIMQRILIRKGFLSVGSDTGIIGPANKNGINRFKESVGIPISNVLVDRLTWRKLLEY